MDGIFGLCVGDALGVPAEFKSREELMADPVVDMRSYGSHRQPAGTWSDDTSLTLCLIDSLAQGLDYNDIMIKFLSWLETGAYSPFGDAFDVGNGTEEAIMRFKHGTPAPGCGGMRSMARWSGSRLSPNSRSSSRTRKTHASRSRTARTWSPTTCRSTTTPRAPSSRR